MWRLMGVELSRLRWRRAVLLLAVAAVAAPLLVFGATAWNTRPYSEAEQAQIARQMARDTERAQDDVHSCVENPEEQGIPPGEDVQRVCEEWYLPQPEWYGHRQALDLDRERLEGSGPVIITLLTVLLLLAGTTFAGHDWNTGSMSNQLLFEPRRVRMWLAKGLVVALAGGALTAAVLAAYWTGLWGLAVVRDIAPAESSLTEAFQQALRGTVLAGVCALGAYALTMLFRSTVATLGVLFGLSILAPIVLALLGIGERWMPHTNLAAILLDGTTYWDESTGEQHRLSLTAGAAYLLVLLVVAVVPSVASFRTRDVP